MHFCNFASVICGCGFSGLAIRAVRDLHRQSSCPRKLNLDRLSFGVVVQFSILDGEVVQREGSLGCYFIDFVLAIDLCGGSF
jgi:hypothetical protein